MHEFFQISLSTVVACVSIHFEINVTLHKRNLFVHLRLADLQKKIILIVYR